MDLTQNTQNNVLIVDRKPGGGATRSLPRDGGVEELHGEATPQGLDQRSKTEEVVPKMARRRGSDAGQLRR